MEFEIQSMDLAWFQIMTMTTGRKILNDMRTKKYTPFFGFIEGFHKEKEHFKNWRKEEF